MLVLPDFEQTVAASSFSLLLLFLLSLAFLLLLSFFPLPLLLPLVIPFPLPFSQSFVRVISLALALAVSNFLPDLFYGVDGVKLLYLARHARNTQLLAECAPCTASALPDGVGEILAISLTVRALDRG
ncbi:hypothetical protein F4810DRAFT_663608 [Camillea tinctor]|nr:hypothetical protein F4810DRAFT_663608 [Camillea tinctor]